MVLDAAIDLVASSGSAQITLDAVALRAGVSKGGLQHHFKSKSALLTEMVAHVISLFLEDLQKAAGEDHDVVEGGIPLALYMERAFSGQGARVPTAKVIFAVYAYDPALLRPLREFFKQRNKGLLKAHGKQLGHALIMMMIADGVWIFDALGASPLTAAERKIALAAALKIVERPI